MGASKGTHKKVLELLGNISGRKVLDCGAGKGSFTKKLIEQKANVSACDIDTSRFNLKVPFKRANFNKEIPFKKNEFDNVVSIEVIEHLENPTIFIQELNRILKKKGEIIITTPNIHNIKSKIQFFFKTDFHWFQDREFGTRGSQHVNPIFWKEIYYLLNKYGFKVDEISTNRYSGYTLYFTPKDNLLKKSLYLVGNLFFDIIYRIVSLFLFPKRKELLLGDILIIKATKI